MRVLFFDGMLFHPGLGARDGQRARGLEHHARVLEHVLDRGAHLVGIGEHHLVHQAAAQPEGLAPDFLHRDAVGEQADMVELDALSGLERARHRRRIDRLDADDFDGRTHALHIRGDAGDQAAAADRDEDRVDRARMLAQDLHADGALPRDHLGIVKGMNVGEARECA